MIEKLTESQISEELLRMASSGIKIKQSWIECFDQIEEYKKMSRIGASFTMNRADRCQFFLDVWNLKNYLTDLIPAREYKKLVEKK